MSESRPGEKRAPTFALVDWLDVSEMHQADAFEHSMDTDAILGTLAQLWRQSFIAASSLPPAYRERVLSLPSMTPKMRGGAGFPGTLAHDYPSELFASLRQGWGLAARAIAYQQSFFPNTGDHVNALQNLALALDEAAPPELAPTPTWTMDDNEWCRLKLVESTAHHPGEPILVVSSLINRWYVLDMLRSNSFLAMIATLGRPVYLLEWTLKDIPAHSRLQDLCSGPLKKAMEFVASQHPGVDHAAAEPRTCRRATNVNLVGYSMGGTLAAVMAARYPSLVARIATVGSPIAFDKAGIFTRWFSPKHFDVGVVARLYDRVPSAIIHLPFWWLRPTIKARKLVQLTRGYRQPGYMSYFYASEIWNNDNVDLPHGLFESWAGDMYQRNALALGQMVVDGEAIQLQRITCPVLVISGDIDKITPPESAEALIHLVNSPYRRSICIRGGHHVRVLTAPSALRAEAEEFQAWLNVPASTPSATAVASEGTNLKERRKS